MPNPDRQGLRLAARIRGQLLLLHRVSTHDLRQHLQWLEHELSRVGGLRRHLVLCEQHGLDLAGRLVLEDLHRALNELPFTIDHSQRAMPHATPPRLPTLRELWDELDQIRREFGKWTFRGEDQTLYVRTPPIELEGVDLGRFEIRLALDYLADPRKGSPYTVVALDPRTPAGHEHVTHPHVSEDRLCEGHADQAIAAALRAGRLCDFFQMVQQVLSTYNPGSPYVALADWDGRPCADCDTSMSDGDAHWCEACERDFCDSCISYCRGCDRSMCMGCLRECPSCNEKVCKECLKSCSQCGEACCVSCLADDLCPTCRQELHNPQSENTDDVDQSNSVAAGEHQPSGGSGGQAA